ncbi:hypothetical protein ACHAXA_008980 [Cyclostephanos tholiformis]|uniref:Uncharacterized protein n=1 Tax=Cyclostephanos tholiformis TaxID=382380 RepID=A0ABD3RHR8_9STRA
MMEAHAELNQATISSVEVAVVSAAAIAAPESSTKRKIMNDVGHHNQHQQHHRQQSANKRQKKNKNGKSHNNSRKNKNNWIENCSETIHRIPTDCQAPLTCIITRVEIDEEPPLEKEGDVNFHGEKVRRTTTRSEKNVNEEKISRDDAENGGGDASAVDKCTSTGNDDGNLEKMMGVLPQAVAGDSPAATNAKNSNEKSSNIARPSRPFFSWYVKEKRITLKGEISSTTVKIAKGTEAKKLFIPVKRHASVIGPTKLHLTFLCKSGRHNDNG